MGQNYTDLQDYIERLHEELLQAVRRIALLEDRLHDHEQAVPHAEAQS